MTQEEIQLLLQDLSARLPYGVIVNTPKGNGHLGTIKLTIFYHELGVNVKATEREYFPLDECKPYLRPMSSMTEEEYNELEVLAYGCDCVLHTSCFPVRCNAKFKTYNLEVINWLNAHHFDYRGLIPMGLALEATEGMYN